MLYSKSLVWILLCSVHWSVKGATVNRQSTQTTEAFSEAPVVDLGYAKYRGAYSAADNISNFVGIRYAAPPLETLRWTSPRPPLVESTIQDATLKPGRCLLVPREMQLDTDTEDCLFLSVHTPGKLKSQQNLPVVVWIYGGGYVTMFEGNGNDLVRISHNKVVAVTIQYRLGIFGFLAGSEVKKGGNLNAGLLDQEFALKWVQKYIHLFGGDPKQVTIWGQSAGGGSVVQQLVSRNGQQRPSLYQSAIISSFYTPSQYKYDDPQPEAIYQDLVNQAGCSTSADTLGCLRKTDVKTLQDANIAINYADYTEGFFGSVYTVPVVDGEFITKSVTTLLKEQKFNTKNILTIANTNEGPLFINQTYPWDSKLVSTFARELFPLLNEESAQKVESAYSSESSNLAMVNRILGDALFTCPTYFVAQSLKGKLHWGEYAVPIALHGDDLPYYFPTTTIAPAFNDTQFIKSFSQTFLNFIISGDPNVKFDSENITPPWPLWKEEHTRMVFNRTEDWKVDIKLQKTDPVLEKRCRLWRSLADQTAQ